MVYISIERDISKTSQKHLKSDEFFVTSLWHHKHNSKRYLSHDVFKRSQTYLRNNVHGVMSLRRL